MAAVIPLEEYRPRRHELEQRQQTLEHQLHQLNRQVDRQQEVAGVGKYIDDFCRRLQAGLAQASFEQKRQLIEWLGDRVIVTKDAVEIGYLIPTVPASEKVHFSDLRLDYHDQRRGGRFE